MLSSTTLSPGAGPSSFCTTYCNNHLLPIRRQLHPSPSIHLNPLIRVLPHSISGNNNNKIRHFYASSAAAAVETFTDDYDSDSSTPLQSKKLGVVVKPMEKPRLVLKFVWMEKNIGLALDQVIPGHGSIPLSPYYFWPRKDAWEELKVMLERKPWISQKEVVILLNQATDIINLWQQSGGDLL
ncbi:hypothetical protein DCAR_0519670 [Daucus carota subsp. sativus]|uniref:30S ribosomal protein 3, chloroplastic n=1 Tax=Daucus carota subsp. sativus TaxID=79200 RepID=A0AAF0X1Z9_DAUCS|nr:PREDICTED: 30S ribosomal protein 3, chloroplastic-like [Daucus carota subsp. sativus]XP_017250145.1 PREDICTED: 30S ribosomal protein 3, chloroplastic-like [Daucus carota subsp. sativus]WOH00311.1 hypothetical protein DCAR_0519670 [Daucus carota subsp. sativus]